jgi:phenylpropionate dioxygenase-like ring-hydroxylating dioxygenase large terminal subunit
MIGTRLHGAVTSDLEAPRAPVPAPTDRDDLGDPGPGLLAVARSIDVGTTPLRVLIGDEPWVLARLDGTLTAARDRCPHRGAPLSAGTVEEGCFTCPYHGWRFAPDGTAVEIPALGEGASLPSKARLRTAALVEERDGLVWVDPGARPAPSAAVPRVLANDDPGLRHSWLAVARSDELAPGASLPVELLGDRCILERSSDGVPSSPAAWGVRDHLGHLWVARDEPVAPLIDLPELDEDGWHHVPMPRIEGRYGAGLLLDNQLDAGHFPFVHRQTFGRSEGAALPPYTVERDGWGFEVGLRVGISARNDAHGTAEGKVEAHRVMTYRYAAPFALFIRLDYEEMGGSTGILFTFTPLDHDRTRADVDLWFRHPEGFSAEQLAERLAFEVTVVAEDMALQDRFDFVELPLTATAEVHTKADKAALEMRRIMTQLLDAGPVQPPA